MNVSLPATRRKVLLASHHASRRGSAISLAELGTRLPDYGYDPVFVFSKPGSLADELTQEGFSVRQVKREGLLRHGTLQHVREIIRHERIDLVHVNSAVPFSKYVALAARLSGVPVVWHIREPVEDKRMKRQRPWVRWLAHRIVVLTRQQEAFFAAPEKTLRVFNGVDLAYFRRQLDRCAAKRALGLQFNEFLFVQVGSIEANKGQTRAVRALAKILPTHPHCRLQIIGGVVEAAEMAEIESLLASDGQLAAAVSCAGEMRDVRPALWAADCLLLPSLRESFPRTVMEALASGVPVVASAVGAIADMIEPGSTGLIVAPGDVDGLARAMREMLQFDTRHMDIMRQQCVESAQALFSMEHHVARIVGIYSSLLPPPALASTRPVETRSR